VGPGAHARRIAGSWLIGIATAFVLLGASIAPFLTPLYIHFEQSRTAVYSQTGYTWSQIDAVTTSILGDLVFWTGDFGAEESKGQRFSGPALTDAERAHMRDVRNVFTSLWLLVLASVVTLGVAFRRARTSERRAATWRGVRTGAAVLAILIAVAGAFAAFAFDAAFEFFHRLFFSAGSYTFDPAHSRLVQLFPERFWSETAIIVGMVIVVVAILVALLAGWRAARIGVVA
jgi:integral membrane protein (TIGR01906 family)